MYKPKIHLYILKNIQINFNKLKELKQIQFYAFLKIKILIFIN